MKKLLALLLALMMALSLAACGDTDDVDGADLPDDELSDTLDDSGDDAATGLTDNNGNEVTQATIDELTEAYNAIAVQFNEIAMTINENGWMEDEQTAAEANAISTTMGFVGAALTEDLTMLDGTDFEQLIATLRDELPPALEEMAERVSEPYGAG